MSSLTRRILATVAVASWVSTTLCQSGLEPKPYDYGFDAAARIERRQQQPQPGESVVVTGAVVGDDGPLIARPEIRELEQDSAKWNLYLLGLSMMQFTNQTLPTSWYGIAVPFAVWSGVDHIPGHDGWPYGYCAHSDIRFPTWHRPYLALFEQVLFDRVQAIASWWSNSSEGARFRAAAEDFRIPYWDWAVTPPEGESVLPLSVGGSPYVVVNGPRGNQTISNPLFSYAFNPLDSTAFHQPPWNQWNWTLRSPTPPKSPDAQSNNSAVAVNLDTLQPSFQARVYNLFSNYDNYSLFSNEAWEPNLSGAQYDSIENLHDTVHSVSGGLNGHMYYIPFSAMDPIFFLHHAMVDRLFAMWQVLYPDSWLIPTAATNPSATTFKGQIENGTTGLAPFIADSNGNLWTSDMVRDPSIFGYTYAEISGASFNEIRQDPDTATRMQNQVITAINRLYGASSVSDIVKSLRDGSRADSLIVGDNYREWVANIRVDRQALDQPLTVHLFLGKAPPDPEDWTTAPNHVGSMGVFANIKMGDMDSTKAFDHVISGTVPLTEKLARMVEQGILPNLDGAAIEPFLKANLEAQVLSADGDVYDVRSIPSLTIEVASALVQAPASENKLPLWGKMVPSFEL